MDSVRVNIQNQEFIETLIESNPELGVKINSAVKKYFQEHFR